MTATRGPEAGARWDREALGMPAPCVCVETPLCNQHKWVARALQAAVQDVAQENAKLRQIIDDDLDGAACLPGCDSYAHEALCPVTATRAVLGAAITRLLADLAAARAALWTYGVHFANCTMPGEPAGTDAAGMVCTCGFDAAQPPTPGEREER